MSRSSRRATALACLVAAVLTFACAAPPNKEIADAWEALKAAETEGAEQYAPATYKSAIDAYRLANAAVMDGDYRLALNRALESRSRAQTAQREAVDARERMRTDAEQTLASVTMLLAETRSRLDEAERARVPARVVREARRTVTSLDGDVLEASAVVKEEDYASAQRVLSAVEERLKAIIATLDTALTAQSQRRRR